jgi:hypothetical protein
MKRYNKAMVKNKIFYRWIFSLSFAAIFFSGCVYLTHMDEALFMKDLDDNQKQMQAELDKEARLYNKLKADIDSGRLKKLTKKNRIFRIYGEPALCKLAEGQSGVKETCIYRKPTGGLLTEVILLNLDDQERLYSWQVQNSGNETRKE